MENLTNDIVEHVKDTENEIEYLKFKNQDITVIYTLSPYDVDFSRSYHPFYDEKRIETSYRKLCASLNVASYDIIKPNQCHGDTIRVAKREEVFKDTDALITNERNMLIALTYADCTPILFYDPINGAVGNAHSGWRGTVQRIGIKTAEKMKHHYGTNIEDLKVYIGPNISMDHFEVREDVKEAFEEEFKELNSSDYIKEIGTYQTGEKKYLVNTSFVNKEILKNLGVKEENIFDSNICTACHPEVMPSHRLDNNSGRSLAIISLKKLV